MEDYRNKKSPGRNPGRVLNPISYEKPALYFQSVCQKRNPLPERVSAFISIQYGFKLGNVFLYVDCRLFKGDVRFIPLRVEFSWPEIGFAMNAPEPAIHTTFIRNIMVTDLEGCSGIKRNDLCWHQTKIYHLLKGVIPL